MEQPQTGGVGKALAYNIGRRTQRTFFWIALVPVGLAIVGWWSARDYNQRLEWVRHTREVLVRIDDISLAITRAETGQRGFLLTGHASYLAPYRQAVLALDSKLKELRALVAGTPEEVGNVDRLATLIREKMNELRETVDLASSEGREQALAIVATDRGQQLMESIRQIAGAITAREQALLTRRINEQTDTRREAATIFILAIVVTLILLLWAQRVISRYAGEREHAEAEVRQLNSSLERRVAEQTASLREANENLRRSNEDLERVAWIATHDLQEPLRMVNSYVSLLARRYQGRLDGDADVYIGFAVDGARKMRDLINDLLAWVRVGVDRPRLANVDCERLLGGVLAKAEPQIAATRAVVTHEPLPLIYTDEERLTTVFQHLLDNAIKFSKPGESPRLHIAARQADGFWHFTFHDEGIGFEPRYAERILVIFQKLHGADKYPGTGLGLAVSRRIVEGLGGRLWAESQPDRGATFSVSLPAEANAVRIANS